MQLRNICSNLFELLILNLIESFLHTFEVLLVLFISIGHKVL
jgi:hypothetical protein